MKSLQFSAPMVLAHLARTKTETRRMPKKNGKPRFVEGDVFYQQEAWRLGKHLDDCLPLLCSPSAIYFEADQRWYSTGAMTTIPVNHVQDRGGRVRASMHLPERFARKKFHVLECEYQNLHDITEDQAIAEGVQRFDQGCVVEGVNGLYDYPTGAYAALWEHINGEGSWALNPKIERIRYEEVTL